MGCLKTCRGINVIFLSMLTKKIISAINYHMILNYFFSEKLIRIYTEFRLVSDF